MSVLYTYNQLYHTPVNYKEGDHVKIKEEALVFDSKLEQGGYVLAVSKDKLHMAVVRNEEIVIVKTIAPFYTKGEPEASELLSKFILDTPIDCTYEVGKSVRQRYGLAPRKKRLSKKETCISPFLVLKNEKYNVKCVAETTEHTMHQFYVKHYELCSKEE